MTLPDWVGEKSTKMNKQANSGTTETPTNHNVTTKGSTAKKNDTSDTSATPTPSTTNTINTTTQKGKSTTTLLPESKTNVDKNVIEDFRKTVFEQFQQLQ